MISPSPGTRDGVAATPGFPPAPRGRSAVEVVDPFDPRLSDFSDLRAPVRRAAWERRRGVCTLEGLHALEALLAGGRMPIAVLAERRWLERLPPLDAPVLVASKSLMAQVTGFAFHRGLLAVAERPAPVPVEELARRAGRILAVEGVNDAENLGALYRNAAAFGVEAVLLDPTVTDPLARRVVRVSSGHALRLPTARATSWPGDLAVLAASGIDVWALTTDADAVPVAELAAARPSRWALLVGAEGPGLSRRTTERVKGRVRVPMTPGVDSLNVATAVAIAMQRLSEP